jgi:hypothetical protein
MDASEPPARHAATHRLGRSRFRCVLFKAGRHWTGHWFDSADGKRRSPDVALNVVVEDDEDSRWIRWPGRWGGTRGGTNPLDSESPRSPGAFAQWDSPLTLMERSSEHDAPRSEDRPRPRAAPFVRAEWAGSRIRVQYTVQPGADRRIPRGLTVTLNSPEEAQPPTTETFSLSTRTGSVDLSAPVDPTQSYDLYISCATSSGLASESVRIELDPAL